MPCVERFGDITYIPTREGWLCLAAILELHSRAVVGWSMSETLDCRLAVDALNMANDKRGPHSSPLSTDCPDALRHESRTARNGKTVLVVDDEPTVCMLFADVLKGLGYAVIEAPRRCCRAQRVTFGYEDRPPCD